MLPRVAMDNLNRSLRGRSAAGTTLQTCVGGFEDQPRVMLYKILEHIIDLNRVATKMKASLRSDDVLNSEDEYP
ncbi:hypothetical protein SASPL_156574 [Salvia splendens]|uniref:Uncharacterized protein n=1 Tax=Salvia splendens TaxID=180675 RepID=A0A8X8VWK8_SALSN|nr:hypothetical protein SASPL_156574 [Salvia splendens]